jgi:CPA2 family monovalent cation:H+ antiporter-2
VAAAIVSIGLNPLLFRAQRAWEKRRPQADATQALPPPAAAPVVFAGSSAVGRRLIERCAKDGLPLNVVTQDLEALDALRVLGIGATYGDPGSAEVLRGASMAQAKMIVVVAPTLMEKIRICGSARAVNPRIAIVATAVGEAERAWLQEFGAAFTCDPLDEASDALLRAIHAGL